jgi:hypothetical protein
MKLIGLFAYVLMQKELVQANGSRGLCTLAFCLIFVFVWAPVTELQRHFIQSIADSSLTGAGNVRDDIGGDQLHM